LLSCCYRCCRCCRFCCISNIYSTVKELCLLFYKVIVRKSAYFYKFDYTESVRCSGFTFATIVANTPSLVIAYAPVPLSSANRNTIIFLSGYTAVSKLLSGFGSLLCLPVLSLLSQVHSGHSCIQSHSLLFPGWYTAESYRYSYCVSRFAFTVSTLILTAFGSSVGVVTGVVGVVGTVVSPTFTPPSKNCVFCSTRSLFANPPTSTNLITLSPLGAPDFTFATIVAILRL